MLVGLRYLSQYLGKRERSVVSKQAIHCYLLLCLAYKLNYSYFLSISCVCVCFLFCESRRGPTYAPLAVRGCTLCTTTIVGDSRQCRYTLKAYIIAYISQSLVGQFLYSFNIFFEKNTTSFYTVRPSGVTYTQLRIPPTTPPNTSVTT